MKVLSFDMGYKNLAYCLLEDKKIRQWKCVNIIEGKSKAKKPSITVLTEALIDYLKQHEELDGVEKVLIEQQPCGFHRRSNTGMKVLSHVLQSYFYGKGKKVSFVSPKRKLKGCPDCKGKPTKERYKIHKQFAIDQTRAHLATEEDAWSMLFESADKQDDLADCLLQGLL